MVYTKEECIHCCQNILLILRLLCNIFDHQKMYLINMTLFFLGVGVVY